MIEYDSVDESTNMYGIFNVPIYKSQVVNQEKINSIFSNLDLSQYTKRIQTGAKKEAPYWNCNAITGCDYINEDADYGWIEEFMSVIRPHIENYINATLATNKPFSYVCTQPWINVYERGDFQELHCHVHGRNVISFSYFHKLPLDDPGCGKFMFKNPNYQKNFGGQDDEYITTAVGNLWPNEKQGDLLIFPSWLEHLVSPHNCDDKRITVSGNIAFYRTGDESNEQSVEVMK